MELYIQVLSHVEVYLKFFTFLKAPCIYIFVFQPLGVELPDNFVDFETQ